MLNERFPYKVIGIKAERLDPFLLSVRYVFMGDTVDPDHRDPVKRSFPCIEGMFSERDEDLPALTDMLLSIRLVPEDLRQWREERRLAPYLERYLKKIGDKFDYVPITAVCQLRWPGRRRMPYELRKHRPGLDVDCYPRAELGLPSMAEGFERERTWRQRKRSAHELGRSGIGT